MLPWRATDKGRYCLSLRYKCREGGVNMVSHSDVPWPHWPAEVLERVTPATRAMMSCDHEALDAQQYSNWTVDYVKDDGCGGCHGGCPDPALASYAAMQAGLTESHRHIFLSTEASPNLTAHSARPDLYGNTHRTGHDSQRARPTFWRSLPVT